MEGQLTALLPLLEARASAVAERRVSRRASRAAQVRDVNPARLERPCGARGALGLSLDFDLYVSGLGRREHGTAG